MLTSSLLCSISLALLALHAVGSSFSMTSQEQRCSAIWVDSSCNQRKSADRSSRSTAFMTQVVPPEDHRGSGR
ncbi:hypothetical protein [Leptolyngbya ohadii]|uniref:hypothetical protein n=1 Tax=Leptolyngbya ohadii TaxID=1962290 RepID=UPI00117A5913|nr:hypothetical protein [Leptolyngbya ohadii]